MEDKELFLKFARQLSKWSKTGKEPKLGDWNVKVYLDMQEKRLKEKGIKRIFDYEVKTKVFKVGDSVIGSAFNGYNKQVTYAMGNRKIEYFKDEKSIYKENVQVPLYQLIKWPTTEKVDWGNETYVCPNCGGIEKIGALQEEGCSYCGTRFLMSELYPKVTNFYTLENGSEKKLSILKILKLAMGSLFVAFLITLYMVFGQQEGYEFLSTFPIASIVCFVLSLFFAPVIFQIAEAMPVNIGAAGAKAKITSRLGKYDKTFRYDYFEGKALSLLRMIIFAENPMEYIQYEGKGLASSFQDIIDMEYRGGIGVKKIQKVGDYIEVTLKVYMKNTYYKRGKCKKKNERLYLHMRHQAEWKVQPDFSVVKVACHSCGGSFNATQYRNCPFCEKEYDAGIDDWVVLDIHK